MDKKELIKFYKDRLKKVKTFHDPKKASTEMLKEKCREYIEFAKHELEAVKNGRNW